MATVTQLTTRHQITIPVEVRRALDLRAGDQVAFAVEGGTVTLRKAGVCPRRTRSSGFFRRIGCGIGTRPRTTRRSVTFRLWDVISVPFPYVDLDETKRRPILVVSTAALRRAHRTCFGAMITTARNLQDVRPDDIEFADLGRAGLSRPCVIRLVRLATFE